MLFETLLFVTRELRKRRVNASAAQVEGVFCRNRTSVASECGPLGDKHRPRPIDGRALLIMQLQAQAAARWAAACTAAFLTHRPYRQSGGEREDRVTATFPAKPHRQRESSQLTLWLTRVDGASRARKKSRGSPYTGKNRGSACQTLRHSSPTLQRDVWLKGLKSRIANFFQEISGKYR